MKKQKIVLASGSPRRKDLMDKTGLDYIIDPADIDEREVKEKSAEKLVEILAIKKAENVAVRHPDSIIIGSDLIVSLNDKQYGKPDDDADAKRMLKILRGTSHNILTGVAVLNTKNSKIATAVEKVDIKMRDYSDKEIDDYILTGEQSDKAGAYAVQGLGGKLLESYKGDWDAIVGLPIKSLDRLIKEVENDG